MSQLEWHNEKRNIEDLKPTPNNPRRLTEEQEKHLGESLDRFNLADPIIINTDNTVIGGHQRLKIMKKNGSAEVDVRVPDRQMTTEEVNELNLRLNRNMGEFDFGILANFDKELLKNIGFVSDELGKIFKVEYGEKDDVVPEEVPSISKTGDLWILEKHRVLCGDGTKKEDVERLMDGKKSNMVFTDPPYNVDYGVSKNPRHKYRTIIGDKLDVDEWREFNKKWIGNIKIFNEGDIYVWGAGGPEGMKQRLWLIELGYHWSTTIIWKKQQLVLTPANYQRLYEPCFYGWQEKSSWQGKRTEVEVWEIDRPRESKLHPTMKPVELIIKGINNSSKFGDIVLDLFLGSGSTLIAAEKTGRICYGIEIDPRYTDVIIKRWEDFTNKKAERIIKNVGDDGIVTLGSVA